MRQVFSTMNEIELPPCQETHTEGDRVAGNKYLYCDRASEYVLG